MEALWSPDFCGLARVWASADWHLTCANSRVITSETQPILQVELYEHDVPFGELPACGTADPAMVSASFGTLD